MFSLQEKNCLFFFKDAIAKQKKKNLDVYQKFQSRLLFLIFNNFVDSGSLTV